MMRNGTPTPINARADNPQRTNIIPPIIIKKIKDKKLPMAEKMILGIIFSLRMHVIVKGVSFRVGFDHNS